MSLIKKDMKIININNVEGINVTADTTLVRADTTLYTADNSGSTGTTIYFDIIPREYVDEVIVEFYNELSQVFYSGISPTVINAGYMRVFFPNYGFIEGNSYELTVYKNDGVTILFRNKCYTTTNDDLPNYRYTLPNNNKIQF
jgi:hypothetical protein